MLFLLGGIIWFLFFSQYSKIKSIQVEVSKNEIGVSVENVYSKVEYLNGKNIFLVNKNKIRSQIKNSFPATKKIDINRDFRQQKIDIKINIYPVAAIWCLNDQQKCFYLNPQGIIFQKSPVLGGNLFLVIDDLSNQSLLIGKKVIMPDFLDFLRRLNQSLIRNKFLIDKLQVRCLPEEEAIVWIKKPVSAKILFSPNLPLAKQIDELKVVIEKINERNNKFYSIDLRIENRAYWEKIKKPDQQLNLENSSSSQLKIDKKHFDYTKLLN